MTCKAVLAGASMLVLSGFLQPAGAQARSAEADPLIAPGSLDPVSIHERLRLKRKRRNATGSRVEQGIAANSSVNEADSLALVAFFNSAGGTSWNDNSGWLTEPVSVWWGVSVRDERVVSLRLTSNNLTGTIPDEIGDLTALEELDLSDFFEEANFLSGSIPSSIGQLVNLRELFLDGNELTGGIPSSIGNLVLLESLGLGSNQLTGSIPTQIGNLSLLEQLFMGGNQLTGAVPTEIGSLTSLLELELGLFDRGNQLSGPIPSSLGNLTNLEDLLMSGNQLEGPIPPELGQLSNLQTLSLSGNRLTGSIPSELAALDNLLLLDVGIKAVSTDSQGNTVAFELRNNLSGEIPSWIGTLPNLAAAYLANNAFSGDLPASFGSAPALQILWLNCNRLEGLPDLSGLAGLADLRVDQNLLTFEDLEPNVGASAGGFNYTPQAAVELEVTSVGASTFLSVDVGGSQNTYQWFLDGASIPGATLRAYSIPQGAPTDASRYHAEVQNALLPLLTLTTVPDFEALVVNTDTDDGDADLADGACDADVGLPGDQCTLRAALEVIAADGVGACACDFEVGFQGVQTIPVGRQLPAISSRVVIEGAAGGTAIQGSSGAGDGIRIEGGTVTLRRMHIDGFGGYGVRISGGAGHTVQSSWIGQSALNTMGGIRVQNGVIGVTIGGLTMDLENVIVGGVSVAGATTRGVSVLRNTLEVPADWMANGPLRMPIDLGENGPTCSSWDVPRTNVPNLEVPAPRILALSETEASGLAQPLSTVIVYEADAAGSGRGRYWGRSLRAVSTAQADAAGAWTATLQGAVPGTTIVVGMVDASGNASELSPIRRPVIFIPGVAGTWLRATDGTNLFFSIIVRDLTSDAAVRNRLDRLRMNDAGTAQLNGEVVVADDILEEVIAGSPMPYRSVLQTLQNAGYPGRIRNVDEATLDLWRFPYDWRRSSPQVANDLRALIDRITINNPGEQPAASCEVDIVTHSNGGMVASAYVWLHREHSKDKVHRLLMNAAPYLGSTQVAKAHTQGYLFDIDQTPWAGPDLDWGRMTRLFRNLPNGYGLLPSRQYHDVQDPQAPGQAPYYLTDLRGRFLIGYNQTFQFMVAPKVNAAGQPEGLNRNGPLWLVEQQTLHDRMSDWRTYDGPPQIFRHVGRVNGGTALQWTVKTTISESDRSWITYHREEGDENLHVAYRESLQPGFGWGDGTVPLVSATLGRGTTTAGTRLGRMDLSGVDESPWIEEFEYFACDHVPIISTGCQPNAAGDTPLGRMLEILGSGTQVQPPRAVNRTSAASVHRDGSRREILYITASARIGVWVADGSGATTGPLSEEMPNRVVSDLPDITYTSTAVGAAVSLPTDRAFTVTVKALGADAQVRVTRASLQDDTGQQLLFEPQALADGGGFQFEFADGSTSLDAALQVDSDGDGTIEVTAGPATQVVTSAPGSAVPFVAPVEFSAVVELGDADPTDALSLTSSGTSWNWRVENVPAWMALDATTGTTPAEVGLSMSAAAAGVGVHDAALRVVFSSGAFETAQEVPVRFAVRDAASVLSSLTIQPDHAEALAGEEIQFWVLARDQFDQPIDIQPTWTATGGSIDATGLYTAGQEIGSFQVTASGASGALVSSAPVEIVSAVPIEQQGDTPTTFTLEQNYPNPFNPSTSIVFSVPRDVAVRIDLYDVMGRHVDQIVRGRFAPGRYRSVLAVGSLSSGIYFYRMEAGDFVLTRSLHILR